VRHPTFGHTEGGLAVHRHVADHLPTESAYQRFNKKVAIRITDYVGSMTCAYIFTLLALLSLPAVLSGFSLFHGVFPHFLISVSIIALVSWVAQTMIQLVLLSVILVGQKVQAEASDARSEKVFEDTQVIADRLDVKTDGGITEILNAIQELKDGK